MVTEMLAGKKIVDAISGADDAAGCADEPLGAAIDRVVVRKDVVGNMMESC